MDLVFLSLSLYSEVCERWLSEGFLRLRKEVRGSGQRRHVEIDIGPTL